VTSAKRLPFLPDVPSIGESIKDFELANWFAFVGPSGIPRPVLERLNADFGKAATSEKLRATWEEQTVTGTTHSLQEVEDHYRSELVRWAKVVKSLGLDKSGN
jgi:tripartite-type tricarboxylate transporter receptor subunit TctC